MLKQSVQYVTGLKMYKIGINAGYSEDFLNSVLKGLSHEIDFNNIDENWQILA